MAKKKILVTGGLGFIGSNFIIHVLKNYPEYKIINLDLNTYAADIENLKEIENNPDYELVIGDIRDIGLVSKLMKDVDFVVHMAAESHVDNSIAGPLIFTSVNVYGTHVLLECAKNVKKEKPDKIERFLYVSTDEVYGSLKPKQRKSKETDVLKPNSPYSASKAAGEHIVRAYYKTFKLPVLITRSSNNYGPRQHIEKLIPKFITNILQGKKVPLMGDGSNIREWIYVFDNCEGIFHVLKKGKIGEIYNIGSGNEKTNREITDIILKYFGKDESWIKTIPHRPGHDFRYALNCSKIKKLGWKPKADFEKTMKETIEWYIKNESWWKKKIKQDS